MTDARWPWPGDRPVDRARRIANALLLLLPAEVQVAQVRAARVVGETWLGAELLRWTEDDTVTTAQAAELVHVSPSQVRKWCSDGLLANRGRGRYRAGDVLACAAARRQERARAQT